MADEIRIKTNNVPRDVIDAWELTSDEREQFNYINWEAVEDGSSSPQFIRYRGQLYDLGEFMTTSGLPEFNPLRRWDGYHSDSFFSGLVVRYVNDFEQVVIGTYMA